MSAWTWLTARMVAADHMVRYEVAEPMTEDQARAWVQAILDALPDTGVAARWRAGQVADDTVSARTSEGVMLWAVLEIPTDSTPIEAARAWLDDWAEALRAQGLEITIMQPRP